MEQKILAVLARQNYVPVKPKALARKIGIRDADYPLFRKALRDLIAAGKAQYGKNHTIRPGGAAADTVVKRGDVSTHRSLPAQKRPPIIIEARIVHADRQ